jgi:hypothetical protein
MQNDEIEKKNYKKTQKKIRLPKEKFSKKYQSLIKKLSKKMQASSG